MVSPTESLGRYLLRRRIARGDVTEVYLAREPEGEGVEALAVIRRVLPERAANREFVERFIAEAELAARLDHPNLVQVVDVGEIDGNYFVATEFVPGGSLLELVSRRGAALPVGLALHVVAEVCAGLQFAHALAGPEGEPLGAVHGDLSPKNVVVSVDGAVKIVDFGLARAWARFGAAPGSGQPGSSAHLAPELVLGGAADRRSDVYACGALLHFLATGRAASAEPAGGADRPAGPVPPSALVPGLAPEVDRAVLKAMAEAPRDRFATCGAMRRALSEAPFALDQATGQEALARLVREAFPEMVALGDDDSLPGEPLAGATSDLATASTLASFGAMTLREAPPTGAQHGAPPTFAAEATPAPGPPPTFAVEATPAPGPPPTFAVEATPAPGPPPTFAVGGTPAAGPPPTFAVGGTPAAFASGATPTGSAPELRPAAGPRSRLGLVLLLVFSGVVALAAGSVGAWFALGGGEVLLGSTAPGGAAGLELPPYPRPGHELPPAGPGGPEKALPPGSPGVGSAGLGTAPDKPEETGEGGGDGLAVAGVAAVGSAGTEPAGEDASTTAAEPGQPVAPGPDEGERSAGTGYLSVLTTPYSVVSMDGRTLGRTPILKLRVPAGRHTLRLHNPEVGSKRVTIRVKRGELTQVRENLWPSNRGR